MTPRPRFKSTCAAICALTFLAGRAIYGDKTSGATAATIYTGGNIIQREAGAPGACPLTSSFCFRNDF